MTIRETINFIMNCIKSFKGLIFAQLAGATIVTILLSAEPYIFKIILDRLKYLLHQSPQKEIIFPILLYLVINFIIVIIFRVCDVIWLNIETPMQKYVTSKLVEHLIKQSHYFFLTHAISSINNKIKDVMKGIPDLIHLNIMNLFCTILSLFISVCTTYSVDYRFALLLCTWVILFASGSILLSRKTKKLTSQAAESRSYVFANIGDVLMNMFNVRLFTARDREVKRIGEILNDYIQAYQSRDWYLVKLFTFQGLSFVIYQCLTITILINGVYQNKISVGDFMLIIMINSSIIKRLWSLSLDITKYAELLGEITQGLKTIYLPLEMENNSKILISDKGDIIFDKVSFHYKNAKEIFNNLNITIKNGQKIGLVGYSGQGKSTFINLILGLYEVTKGQIIIGDNNINNISTHSLHNAIAVIPQEPILFNRSILENIRYGLTNASFEEVIEAAKKSYAHEFILKISDGYNALVGDRGIKLSGGERQRIAIARAILKNAPILILDEATSQIDSVIEKYIQDALWKLMKDKTTIVIAHRLSTILHMDRLLVFNEGRIVEDGSHSELLKFKEGLYYKLWSAQSNGFIPYN